jgi:hypothetical protein
MTKVIPHLTIGHADQPPTLGTRPPRSDLSDLSDLSGLSALQAAAESVGPFLPIEAVAAQVSLMAGPRPGDADSPPGRWRTIADFTLG